MHFVAGNKKYRERTLDQLWNTGEEVPWLGFSLPPSEQSSFKAKELLQLD